MDTLVLFVTLEEKLSTFHYQPLLTVGFLCMAFTMLMYILSIPTFFEDFYPKIMLYFFN